MSYPVVALVGAPNVGKSTLFNRLTRTRAALVSDFPGLTRDRHYGHASWGDFHFIVIDTAGIRETPDQEIESLMADQSWLAVEEADVVFFVVDTCCGLSFEDKDIANRLRRLSIPVLLVANKSEGGRFVTDFFALGLGEPFPISATHGEGVGQLMHFVIEKFSRDHACFLSPELPDCPCFSVVGQPNTGKSTFVNSLLGEERLLVSEQSGTTRDAISVDLMFDGHVCRLVDTAGVRQRHKVHEKVEKFSVVKTLQAIHDADVVLFFLDACRGITHQDMHLAGYLLEEGRAVVLVVNKWDLLEQEEKNKFKKLLRFQFSFFDFSPICYISARYSQGVFDVLKKAKMAYDSARRRFSTAQLTRTLIRAVAHQSPPRAGLTSPKLRYAHQGGHNPPVIVVHGSSVRSLPDSYRRYLSRFFRKQFNLQGAPLRVEFKLKSNPYVTARFKE